MKIQDSSIFIRNLRCYAYHGVLPQERRVGAWYVITLRVHYNICKAMQSDDVDDTINYASLCELILQEMSQPSCLLEHAAARVVQAIFSRYPLITALDLTLTKENPPMRVDCAGAGVELHLINDKSS